MSSRTAKVRAWSLLIVQMLLLAAIIFLPGRDDWTSSQWLPRAAWVLEFAGLAIVAAGLLNLGRSATPLPIPVSNGELRSRGLYRYVRHPIYSGLMAFALGSATRSGSMYVALAAIGLIGWLMFKARWEERWLRERYPEYEAYAARTPRFVPLTRR
jgi:protein-S-isoprenylcysteine O-methyltransferase Ste14